MICSKCGAAMRVTDTRDALAPTTIKWLVDKARRHLALRTSTPLVVRRYLCTACPHRMQTAEVPVEDGVSGNVELRRLAFQASNTATRAEQASKAAAAAAGDLLEQINPTSHPRASTCETIETAPSALCGPSGP